MKKETLYKTLDKDGKESNGGRVWSLPQGDQPGEWMPLITGKLTEKNGYRLRTQKQLPPRLDARIFIAEHNDYCYYTESAYIARQARLVRELPWNVRIRRLFACDCAEDLLEWESADKRPRYAIETARKFANGEASGRELKAAEWNAWDAAREAMESRAWYLAMAAQAAVRGNAGDAAQFVLDAVVEDRRQRQVDRLFEILGEA